MPRTKTAGVRGVTPFSVGASVIGFLGLVAGRTVGGVVQFVATTSSIAILLLVLALLLGQGLELLLASRLPVSAFGHATRAARKASGRCSLCGSRTSLVNLLRMCPRCDAPPA